MPANNHFLFMNTRLAACIVFLFVSFYSYAQERKDLKVSLATGFFNSSYHANSKSRQFYNFSFDYFLASRHILSADFISGQYRYYDSVRVTTPIPLTTPGFEKHTNAEANTMVFSVLYKYRLVNHKRLSVNTGAGLGIIAETFTYPVDIPNGGFTFESSGGKGDLCFPLRLDIDYRITRGLQLGLMAGTYIYPDYPFTGEHLGIRLSYVIK